MNNKIYIEIPKYCPVCGGETEVVTENTSEVLMCKNPNCSGKLLSKLKFFVSKPAMNIDGLSEATLEKFIELGWLTKFIDIYYLDVNKTDMIKLDGFGEKSVHKLLESIEKSKNVKLENFICALSIDGVGKSASKTIAEAFKGDFKQLLSAFKNGYNWADLSDIGEKTSENITKYFTENEAKIVDLASEMNFIVPTKTEVVDNPLNGLKFCITGNFSQSRDILKEKLEAKGAKFVSGVSKNIDVLFCGEKAGSKFSKAKSLGIKVVYEQELIKMLDD
jgi:DNA ligase (NAD+)